MDNVLVLSTNQLFNKKMKRILTVNAMFHSNSVNLNILNRLINQKKPKVLIVHHSVNCMNITKLFNYLVVNKIIPIIYINNTINYGQFYQVLNDPFFINIEETKMETPLPIIINYFIQTKKEIIKLYQQVDRLESKLKDKETIHQAKYKLMERKKMTEDEAHQYIVKEAMNKRVSKKQIALEILKNN